MGEVAFGEASGHEGAGLPAPPHNGYLDACRLHGFSYGYRVKCTLFVARSDDHRRGAERRDGAFPFHSYVSAGEDGRPR